eukprot:TRINITY_DN35572_c0_g1_i2.p1 TRINITY_DN35572_c0_g1~~TRINITY_DN35572_c0_g1_i2.p1  ORF type:complete len:2564 (+),score=512.69 TRINITY_DN35572_c0_g1_i2:166-7857(+)
MPVSLTDDQADDPVPSPVEWPPTLLNEKFTVHSYDGGSQQNRTQYDVKHVLIPSLEPFHCSDRGSKFNLVLKCSEDFTLTHFYISGPGPRCTEPIRSGLVWVCDSLPKDLNKATLHDGQALSLGPEDKDDMSMHSLPCEEDGESLEGLPEPCASFVTDVESREAEVELARWQEGRYLIIRLLDTHYADEQVNVDVGMVGLVGFWGRCARHQVPLGPWMRRRLQQAWVHVRPLQRTFSSGGWVCDGRDFTGGCRSSFLDFHQTNIYTSRFHCAATGFDLCDACAHDPSLGRVTEASVKADMEAMQSPGTCRLVGNRLRNLWRRHWLHALPRYLHAGFLSALFTSLQRYLDGAQPARPRATEEEATPGRTRGRTPRAAPNQDPQQTAAIRALLQLVMDLVQGVLLGVRPGCDVQVNDLVWALSNGQAHDGAPDRWERCRVVQLPPSFPCVNPAAPTVAGNTPEEDDEEMDGGGATAFRVSSRDWKSRRYVQAEHVWKITKPMNDEEVMTSTTSLFREVSRGQRCDMGEVRRLLRQSADLSAANAEGQTALLGAAQNGCSPEVLSLLLEAKACPDQSDRHGATPLQIIKSRELRKSSDAEAAMLEHSSLLLRRHGATECEADAAASNTSETMSSLQETLGMELLGPLLMLRGPGGNGPGENRPPPPEALEAVLLLIRALPLPALRRALLQPDGTEETTDSQVPAAKALGALMQKAVEGSSGPSSALHSLRLARALQARAREEPQLLTMILRHGVHRWARQISSLREPLQVGFFGPALPHEKAASQDDLLREAKAFCDELSSGYALLPRHLFPSMGVDTTECGANNEALLWQGHKGLAGAVALLDEACETKLAEAVNEAFVAVRDLLLRPQCTAFELETSNLAGRLLKLLQTPPGWMQSEDSLSTAHWQAFRQAFGLCQGNKEFKGAFHRLLEALHAVISTGECFPTWRYKRDRGLKALTEPVQLRLERHADSVGAFQEPQQVKKEIVSIMVEPLVTLNEIRRYLLRATPIVNEHYLSFCHGLVGGVVKDCASGERGKVLSFELLFTDCSVPVHSVHFEAAGETRRLLLAMRDYEYLAPPLCEDDSASVDFKVALSLLHLSGGSCRYASLLDVLRSRLQSDGGNVAGGGDSAASSDSESSSGRSDGRRRSRRRLSPTEDSADPAAAPMEVEGHEVEEALSRAVQAAAACSAAALGLVDSERDRVTRASDSAAAAAGDETGQAAAVEPGSRVHSVTLNVPDEIPLDVFWPMVQEDIIGAVQEFYPRGMPAQVQEVLQTGAAKDGVIAVAQRLTLEEAEMLAARLAHLAQMAVAVDMNAVRELRRLNQRLVTEQQEPPREGRWPPQLAARAATRQASAPQTPTAPAVASRVRLRSAPDSDDWISGVVVGHGPPDAPWRCVEAPGSSSADAPLHVVDDQGVLWEQLPPTHVKLPAVQKSSGGATTSARAADRQRPPLFEVPALHRRPPPPPPVVQDTPQMLLHSLQMPQPPPPPLQPPVLLPVGSPTEEAFPGLGLGAAVQEPMDRRSGRRGRHRRGSNRRSGSGSRSQSRSGSRSRSRARARRAREAAMEAGTRENRPSSARPVGEAPSDAGDEGSGRSQRKRTAPAASEEAADTLEPESPSAAMPPATPPSRLVRVGSSGRASEERDQDAPSAPSNVKAATPRRRFKGALADVLRGELPSFARAADSQDPTTLLGHPVAVRLSSEDLEEEEEASEAKKEVCWLTPPKLQVRFALSPQQDSADGCSPVALPSDWNLLRTLQFLNDQRSSGKACEAMLPSRGLEKVSLENWHLVYSLEAIDAAESPQSPLTARPLRSSDDLDIDAFALPPAADASEAATSSTASERSLSLLGPLSFSSASSPASVVAASPRCTPHLAPSIAASPRPSPALSPASAPKRRRAVSSNPLLLQAESPSLVARDLYFSPSLQPSSFNSHAEVKSLLRQCLTSTGCSVGSNAVVDTLELLSLLHRQLPEDDREAHASFWVSAKLDWKLSHQLEDPLSVSSGALPLWATTLPRVCPFLFSFQTRKMLLRYTAFGPSLAVHWAQESKVGSYLRRRQHLPTELGAAAQGDPRKVEELLQEVSNIEDHVVRSEFWLGALQSTLLRLQRGAGREESRICEESDEAKEEDSADDMLLQQAEAAMELVASSDRMLEVQFDSETGFGSAVTRSFYAEVARALQGRAANRKAQMWVEDDTGGGGSSSSSGGSGQHIRCRCGLVVRPLPPGSDREAAACRFRFLGRLVGRALKDGFIVPLPLGEAFFARALLGQPPPQPLASKDGAGLPRPGAGCVGELCGALADFAFDLQREKEEFCRQRHKAGLDPPSEAELRGWCELQGERPDFTARYLVPPGGAASAGQPVSFNHYMSLVGASFLETGFSGEPLCPGGEDRPITVFNVLEFVQLAASFWLDTGVAAQLEAFRGGLNEVVPVECFMAFSAAELRDMICGQDSVEWGERELLDHLHPSGGFTEHSPAYQHLVAVLLDMDQASRSRFLDFVSSCPRFPPGGIDSFHVDVFPDSDSGRGFPRSRACANQLYLPLYRSKEELRERLHEAIHGSSGHHEQEQRIVAS